ncbi:MAG: hypothetical protein Q8N52_04380 [Acidobacteriota bacterium]|nr:hypothetical protein [Acidobacteriota bacterium]MDP2389543.1 hypothetical protein [Acidobacteriota bacterium]
MEHARLTVNDWSGLASSAVIAVLAVALSASPVFAQRVTVAASGSTSLVISVEAVLSVTSPASLVPFATAVSPEAATIARRGAP